MSFPSQDSVREGIAPGTLHHVMVRGIEGNCIFTDDEDRLYFVLRMGKVAAATGTSIYAWALMTNHAHILLKSARYLGTSLNLLKVRHYNPFSVLLCGGKGRLTRDFQTDRKRSFSWLTGFSGVSRMHNV